MEGGSKERRRAWSAKAPPSPPYLSHDLLPSIFLHLRPLDLALARCCLVSKSRKDAIYNSKRLANQHFSKNYLAHYGLEQHALSLISDSCHVRQWNAHSVGYMDPDAVVGCGDGTARIFDMYGQSCSRMIKMHQGPISCLALTEDQLIISGSTLGCISIAGLSCDQDVAELKSPSPATGIRTLCYNPSNYQVFAGSTSGHAHSWDIRTGKMVWEARVSPNVIYSMQHMSTDTSTLVVGGVDGVLRIVNQDTGEVKARYVMTKKSARSSILDGKVNTIKSMKILEDNEIGLLPMHIRPPISSLAVGWKKVVTVHNGRFIRLWKFNI